MDINARIATARMAHEETLNRQYHEMVAWVAEVAKNDPRQHATVDPSDYRRQYAIAIPGAVNYVKRYYPEIKLSRKEIERRLREPGTLEFVRSKEMSFMCYGRTSTDSTGEGHISKQKYLLYSLDSVDEWAARQVLKA